MNQAVLELLVAQPETVDDPYSPLFRFTVDQFQQLIDRGVVQDGAAVELLDGVIFNKNRADSGENPMVHGSQHALLEKIDSRADSAGRATGIGIAVPIANTT
jgi:hypothetical protein